MPETKPIVRKQTMQEKGKCRECQAEFLYQIGVEMDFSQSPCRTVLTPPQNPVFCRKCSDKKGISYVNALYY